MYNVDEDYDMSVRRRKEEEEVENKKKLHNSPY